MGGATGDAGIDAGVGAPTLKLLIAFHDRSSVSITDPGGARLSALASLLDSQPASTSVLVAAFSGSTTTFIAPTGQRGFTSIAASTSAQRMAWRVPSTIQAEATDFVAPLHALRDAIASDLARGESARYEVIFVTDGAPTVNQDAELLCGNAATDFSSLSNATNQVQLNTVFVFAPASPACNDPIVNTTCQVGPAASGCLASAIAASQKRLERMATLGHGQFRAFTTSVDFSFVLAP